MRITDLSDEHCASYYVCLEDWSEDMKDAGSHKESWCARMKDKGMRVKMALDDDKACGMIQYIPAEYSNVDGKGIYFIQCIWVHGHKKGIGNYQKKGIGKALLQAAENDARSMGVKGMAAWGLSLPIWMKASWYKKQGYKKVDKDGVAVLLWKSFVEDAVSPKWIKQKKKPGKMDGKVVVTSFINGWCPAQNIVFERAKRASSEFDDAVEFQEIHTFDREVFQEWGLSDALFIDDKQVRTGPPPSIDKIRKKIARRVKRLDRH